MPEKVMRVLTVLNIGGDEAIYVDGQLMAQEYTLYLVDIYDVTRGKLCRIHRLEVSLPEDLTEWPATEESLLCFATNPQEVHGEPAE